MVVVNALRNIKKSPEKFGTLFYTLEMGKGSGVLFVAEVVNGISAGYVEAVEGHDGEQ